MKALVNRIAAALSIAVVAAPLAAQNAPACDPTANTKGDIARAQFSMTRAISASEKGNPTLEGALVDYLMLGRAPSSEAFWLCLEGNGDPPTLIRMKGR